jgi:hypothetical protein
VVVVQCISEEQGQVREQIGMKSHNASYLFTLSQSGNQLDAERIANKLRYPRPPIHNH